MLNQNNSAKFVIGLLYVGFFLMNSDILAASKVFEREYTYQAGEIDSKISSRVIALEQVKRLLLEELGTVIISSSTVVNSQVTKDEITSIAGAYVKTVIINEFWDGNTYRLRARIEADPDEVLRFVQKVTEDKQRESEIKNNSKQRAALTKQLEILKNEIRKSPNKDKENRYNEIITRLTVLDLLTRTFSNVAEAAKKDFNDPMPTEEIKSEIKELIYSFDNIIRLIPDWSLAYHMRSLLHSELKQYANELSDIDSALKYNKWNIPDIMLHDIEADDVEKINTDLRMQRAYLLFKLRKDNVSIGEIYALLQMEPRLKLDWRWADDDLNYLVKKYSKDNTSYIVRGIHYSGKGLTDRKYADLAIKDFKKALTINAGDALSSYLLAAEQNMYDAKQGGWSRSSKERRRLSEEILRKASKLSAPPTIKKRVYDLLASICNGAKRYDEALAFYDKALAIDPEDGELYLNKARMYHEAKNYEDAIKEYSNALSAKKQVAFYLKTNQYKDTVLGLRADANHRAERYTNAEKDYTQIIDRRTKEAMIDGLDPFLLPGYEYRNRGRVYYDAGKYSEAIDDFTNAMKSKLMWDNDIYQHRARAYVKLGKYKEALADYNEFLGRWNAGKYTKDANPWGVYCERGNVLFALGQYKDAIADYDSELKSEPDNYEALANRGTCYLKLGIYAQAVKDFNNALRLMPNDAVTLTRRGYALMSGNNLPDAMHDFNKALNLDATNEAAYYYRCVANIKLGQRESGITDCRIAAKLGNEAAQNMLQENHIAW